MKRLINKLSKNNEKVENGILNKLNKFCTEKISSPLCKKFYNDAREKNDGILTCPYGFNCIKKCNNIYNCILIKENYNNSKMKMKKDIKQQIFFEKDIFDLIKIDEENEKNHDDFEQLFKSMNDFLHDVTKVNKMIETKSHSISKADLTKRDAAQLESIYHLSDFITKRIELYRFTSNPAIISTGRKRQRNAYQLWDIYRHIFNDIGRESNIVIDMKIYNMSHEEENDKKTIFEANDSITVLPYLLIDNAVKYSENNSVIKVRFFQDNNILKKITISSRPSYVIVDDSKLFFERGYRSLNNTSKSSGSGLGLNIVKQICDYNNIKIEIDIDADENGKQKFVISMNFDDEVKSD